MNVIVDKYQAANKQLNTAITLYLAGDDIVSVQTLVGASHNIVHDLVENKYPNKSWENTVANDSNMQLRRLLAIAREAQNFLKHAKSDPSDIITINSDDTEHLLFLVIQNLCILLGDNEKLSNEASTFQLWFMATHNYTFNEYCLSEKFKGIEHLSKNKQIEYGNKLLSENKNHA